MTFFVNMLMGVSVTVGTIIFILNNNKKLNKYTRGK